MTAMRKVLVGAAISFLFGAVTGSVATYLLLQYANASATRATLAVAHEAYKNKRFYEATGLAYGAIARSPDHYAPYLLLGDIYAAEGKNEIAGEMYKTALEKANRQALDTQTQRAAEHDKRVLEEKIRSVTEHK